MERAIPGPLLVAYASTLIALLPCCAMSTGASYRADVSTDFIADHAADDPVTEDPVIEDPAIEDPVAVDPEIDDVGPDAPELPPGLVWASLPEGTFEMGCSAGDPECGPEEEARHSVTVSAFEMTVTEITQDQYAWVTGGSPSHFAGCPACPVEMVSWHEAGDFCRSIGGRLPSEAEWEYAARGGTATRYYCGDDAACLDAIAWYRENSSEETHAAGEKTANGFGLYDVLGNVLEWVEDCWHDNYTGAPSTGEVWSGGDCPDRVVRGGSWLTASKSLRASNRGYYWPDLRMNYLGFRCAR